MSKTREARREFWRQLISRSGGGVVSLRALCQEHGSREYTLLQWRNVWPAASGKVGAGRHGRCDAGSRSNCGSDLDLGQQLLIQLAVNAASPRLFRNLLREGR